MTIFDFSKVPAELLNVVPEAGPYVNAGILHNIGLCKVNEVFSNMGLDTDPAISAANVISFSEKAESDGILPKGSTSILNEALTKFLNSSTFSEGSKIWNEYLTKCNEDGNFKDTQLISVLSVGYYSSRFWTYSIEILSSNNIQNAQYSKFKWPRWIHVICSDITGAISGAHEGAQIATALGINEDVGTVVGAVVGGVGSSISAANS